MKGLEWWWDKGSGGEILTGPSLTILCSQSGLLPQRRPCHYRSWEPSQPAASGPHADLALFSQTYRCKQGKHKAEPHRNTHTHFTFAYHWLLCHYHPQSLQGRHLSYFKLHKWPTSLTVTKHPARPQVCTDEICKANVMNHNENPLLLPHPAYAVNENLKLWITSSRLNIAESDCPQVTTGNNSVLPDSTCRPVDTIQVYDIHK